MAGMFGNPPQTKGRGGRPLQVASVGGGGGGLMGGLSQFASHFSKPSARIALNANNLAEKADPMSYILPDKFNPAHYVRQIFDGLV